ncbi:MAG: hypothetical protein QNK03_16255 [Myxococcota bacterium]|nr:hypothetical protein [Myxococcota bacterium]
MQSDPNAPSSDLERARAITKRLRRPGARRGREATPRVGRPIAGAAGAAVESAAVCEDATGLGIRAADNLGSRFWNDLLSQCLELVLREGGTAAFAVDERGLGIAQVGDLDSAEVEGTGSRLVIALEQASRMESFAGRRPGSILIEFGRQWLTGFAIEAANGTRVVLGIVASEPLAERSRERVSSLVTELLT